MKLQFKTVLGIILLVATAIAQEAPQDKQPDTNAAAKRAASGSTASKKRAASNTAGAIESHGSGSLVLAFPHAVISVAVRANSAGGK